MPEGFFIWLKGPNDLQVVSATSVWSCAPLLIDLLWRVVGHGGGWGYSAHSVEAIRFCADADIVLGGLGLFGGRGEYTAKIKVTQYNESI